MRCLFSPSSSSPFFYIDTGQKGLRCDAMPTLLAGRESVLSKSHGTSRRTPLLCAEPSPDLLDGRPLQIYHIGITMLRDFIIMDADGTCS